MLENSFQTLFLTAEAWLVHCLPATAAISLGTLELHGEFYEIGYIRLEIGLSYIYIYIYIYNLYDIWGVKLAKTQYLPTSFKRRLFQSRRIYRFISICELCLQLENLTSYK